MGRKAVKRLFYNISIFCTLIISIACVSGAFAAYISPDQNIVLPFIGLILPVIIFINIFLFIYWALRWRVWALVALLAIVSNYGYLSRILHFGTTESLISTERVITMGTYNVASFNLETTGFYCKSISEFMNSQEVDILCMQEFYMSRDFNEDSTIVAFDAWPYYSIPLPPDDKKILNVALFSKYPILSTQLITHPDSKNCSMICDLDINGTTVRVFNNHLQTTDVYSTRPQLAKEIESKNMNGIEHATYLLAKELKINYIKRAEQANEMAGFIEQSPYPTIVCGDFNSPPSSYTYRTMRGKLNDGFQLCGSGYMYTYRYFKHLLRIDYIFVSNDFTGMKYYSPKLEYSDHNPVIMKMRF